MGGSSGRGGDVQSPPSQLGRPDRQGGLLGGRPNGQTSQSGRVTYGGSNNGFQRGGAGPAPQINGLPPGGNNRVSQDAMLNDQARRRDNWRDNDRRNDGWRNGYFQYNYGWDDNRFWYPHYAFNWDPYRCVPSPFYYYSNLPGYISLGRVTILLNFVSLFNDTRYNYDWSPGRGRYDYERNNRWDRELDYAVEDIVDAFERRRARTLWPLIYNDSSIYVDVEGEWRYQMRGIDFCDLMQDLVESTETESYRIRSVRTGRDGRALIEAEHVFRDAWGRRQGTRHSYGLEELRNGRFAIREFRVSRGW